VRESARDTGFVRMVCGRSSGPKIPAIGIARSFPLLQNTRLQNAWALDNAQYEHI
jgi:hypothetical protein